MAFGMGFATNSMNIPALTGKVMVLNLLPFVFCLSPLDAITFNYVFYSHNASAIKTSCEVRPFHDTLIFSQR